MDFSPDPVRGPVADPVGEENNGENITPPQNPEIPNPPADPPPVEVTPPAEPARHNYPLRDRSLPRVFILINTCSFNLTHASIPLGVRAS